MTLTEQCRLSSVQQACHPRYASPFSSDQAQNENKSLGHPVNPQQLVLAYLTVSVALIPSIPDEQFLVIGVLRYELGEEIRGMSTFISEMLF